MPPASAKQARGPGRDGRQKTRVVEKSINVSNTINSGSDPQNARSSALVQHHASTKSGQKAADQASSSTTTSIIPPNLDGLNAQSGIAKRDGHSIITASTPNMPISDNTSNLGCRNNTYAIARAVLPIDNVDWNRESGNVKDTPRNQSSACPIQFSKLSNTNFSQSSSKASLDQSDSQPRIPNAKTERRRHNRPNKNFSRDKQKSCQSVANSATHCSVDRKPAIPQLRKQNTSAKSSRGHQDVETPHVNTKGPEVQVAKAPRMLIKCKIGFLDLPMEILIDILTRVLRYDGVISVSPTFTTLITYRKTAVNYSVLHTCIRLYEIGLPLYYSLNTWAIDVCKFQDSPDTMLAWPERLGFSYAIEYVRRIIIMATHSDNYRDSAILLKSFRNLESVVFDVRGGRIEREFHASSEGFPFVEVEANEVVKNILEKAKVRVQKVATFGAETVVYPGSITVGDESRERAQKKMEDALPRDLRYGMKSWIHRVQKQKIEAEKRAKTATNIEVNGVANEVW